MAKALRQSGSPAGLALSLFSGAGGMDVGVLQAGFDVLACVEQDPNACETLRVNAMKEGRSTLVIENDIREVSPEWLKRSLHLAKGELDLLFGGPPCQTFSQIGKQQGISDERGLLLFEMTRFAEVFRPKAIVIENVKGLLSAPGHSGKRGEVMAALTDELHALGYEASWRVLTAADFGAPQLRHRVFIVAMRNAEGFAFPDPSHAPAGTLLGAPYVTVGDALRDLPPPLRKDEAQVGDSHVDITPPGDRRRIAGVHEGAHLAASVHLPEEQRGRLSRKDTTKFLRTHREKPSNTLRCGEVFFHPTEDRYLTPREYMRLHGYPDTYELRGPLRGRTGVVKQLDQHRLVANSVSPPVARAVALSVRKALECQRSLKRSATR